MKISRRIILLSGGIILLIVIAGFYKLSQKNNTAVEPFIPTLSKNGEPSPKQIADIPKTTIVAQGLEVPWAIAFLSDARILVTERPGRVRIVNVTGDVDPNPAVTINVDSRTDGEGGLLGIVLHPDFSNNHFVYLYYTYQSSGNKTLNRVVRMKCENNKLSGEEVLIDKIPGAIYHNGGRIKFGPDGFLYITTGDSRDSSLAQDKNSLAGKILRSTDEGKPAPGNPFGNLIYSYGHRNPQGIAWDANGKLWETEHGRSNPTGFDEVNLIEGGKNYGWEIIQGDETRSGMETPKINSGANGTWAPSGVAIVGNSLFFSGLKGETLYEAKINGGNISDLKKHFEKEFGRIREVILGPDGMLYVTTSNRDGRGSPKDRDDKIIRVNPTKL